MSDLADRLKADLALEEAQALRLAEALASHSQSAAAAPAPQPAAIAADIRPPDIPEAAYIPLAQPELPQSAAFVPGDMPDSSNIPDMEYPDLPGIRSAAALPGRSDEQRISAAALRSARLAPDMELWGEKLS